MARGAFDITHGPGPTLGKRHDRRSLTGHAPRGCSKVNRALTPSALQSRDVRRHLKLVTSNAVQRDLISGSSVADPAAGRHDAVILVASPIRSQAWIAQGKWNRDERVAAFIEHEVDLADVAVKELIRGWSIPLVCQLEAAGRTDPGHDDSRAAQSAPIRVTNVPAVFTRGAEI